MLFTRKTSLHIDLTCPRWLWLFSRNTNEPYCFGFFLFFLFFGLLVFPLLCVLSEFSIALTQHSGDGAGYARLTCNTLQSHIQSSIYSSFIIFNGGAITADVGQAAGRTLNMWKVHRKDWHVIQQTFFTKSQLTKSSTVGRKRSVQKKPTRSWGEHANSTQEGWAWT